MKLLRSPYLAAASVAWIAAAALIGFCAAGEARRSLLAGWGLAGLTGALSFGFLAYADGRAFKTFLSSVFGGFLARLVLVVLGFLWAIRSGYSPGWICVSFFALYWIFFACELLAMRGMTPGLKSGLNSGVHS